MLIYFIRNHTFAIPRQRKIQKSFKTWCFALSGHGVNWKVAETFDSVTFLKTPSVPNRTRRERKKLWIPYVLQGCTPEIHGFRCSEDSLSKAEKVTADAEQQAEKNEEILNQARKEAQEIVSKARDAGDALKQKLELDGKEQYIDLN